MGNKNVPKKFCEATIPPLYSAKGSIDTHTFQEESRTNGHF